MHSDRINRPWATIAKLCDEDKFLSLPPVALVERISPKFPRCMDGNALWVGRTSTNVCLCDIITTHGLNS
jgi:hypothetical protein